MSTTSIQDLLALVQKPSRYLGSEVNRAKKSWDDTQLHVALAFPDLYEIATSHFGIQILYTMLNEQSDIMAERVYAPALDMEAQLRDRNQPLSSLESEIPLKRFDIVGFSLLYELNYTNMVNMLDLAGIAFFSRDRQADDPFVIGGGPCTCNPEPVAEFFDAMVIGDGEAVILKITDAWKRWRQSDDPRRSALLDRWSKIQGVYIPSKFDVANDRSGNYRLIPRSDAYRHVDRAVAKDLNRIPFPTAPIIPFGKPVHDRLRMEIARGCTRGCRFCQAGMIYRPVRERHPQRVLDAIRTSLKKTGYEDLSLLSLSTGDYSCIAPLMKHIMEFGEKDRLAVSLPSLRAGSLSPELMGLIRKVRKTGFTIAPEAGSQRLRDVINKNISEADIFQTVENAFALGWKLIKLYFMIGLPTETPNDLGAIVDMVQRLKTLSRKTGQRARINVSIATFVPKPHTPFQWDAQIDLATAMEKLNWLKDALAIPGVQVKWQDPRVSVIEGVWARGDRSLNSVLVQAWKKGCRFDGWTDFFDYERWLSVFENGDIDTGRYTAAKADTARPLPWDHIHSGVSRAYLLAERARAADGKITLDCRTGSCTGCGVCDFDRLKPISFHQIETAYANVDRDPVASPSSPVRYVVSFKKMGPARFLGHLEMVKVFTRSIRRACLPISYSHGFHPMPKISFGDTLPMGMQSEHEQMAIVLNEPMASNQIALRLQDQLPVGLQITDCFPSVAKPMERPTSHRRYHVELKDGFFDVNDLDWFLDQRVVNIERKRKRGPAARIDLKQAVLDIQVIDDRHAQMLLGSCQNQTIRPAVVLKTIFHLSDQQILTAIITKQKNTHV